MALQGSSGSSLVKGWYLIDCQLPSGNGELAAWTLVDGQEGVERMPLPVTLKGRIFELVSIPAKSLNLSVLAQAGGADVEPLQLTVRRVTSVMARLLMWSRVFGALPGMPLSQRRVLGLSWPAGLLEPHRSYRQVSKLRAYFPAPCYKEWIQRFEEVTPRQAKRLRKRLKRQDAAGLEFSVLIDARGMGDMSAVRQSVEAVARQWEVRAISRILIEDTLSQRAALDNSLAGLSLVTEAELLQEPVGQGRWVVYVSTAVVLAPWAMAWLACEALSRSGVALMYSDHDYLSTDGERREPQFKPDFSLELARSSAYVGDLLAIREGEFRDVVRSTGLGSAYAMVLEFARLCGSEAVYHVPAILWHQAGRVSVPDKESLESHLRRSGVAAEVVPDRDTLLRVRYELPAVPPKVSIIVPTRDMLHFLKPCIESLLARTTWPDYEILIVDNQSTCRDTLTFMETVEIDDRVRILRYNQAFNFSAINNFAVEHAAGEVVCLLNNDTEVLTPGWLEEMVSRLLQPGVGVVGARLYFTDGRIQHAGDVLGPGGCASHLHGPIEGDDPGYMGRALLAQDLSAVTAACLVTQKELYLSLGGLEEERLPVAFNDVDYCLRVRESGYKVIYTPYAELYHHESVSRGKDDDPVKTARARRESEYMRSRWAAVIERDPFYNPNLNYSRADFRLGRLPRVGFPWIE
uniref:glycosyltransferase family 2 protein n=1 Tax=Marinobacterium profundum TaxID=1714300 RepID=UPI000836637D|nr:glycosyltransferase family 2 protein [Marinobacterium profundum]